MLSDFYPPIIGGIESHVSMLSDDLVHRGYDVTVFTVRHGHLPRDELLNGVKIIRREGFFQKIPLLFHDLERRYPPPVQDLLMTKQLRDVIASERPDIIHAHSWILFSFLPIKEEAHVPLVVTLHDYGFICPKKDLMNFSKICTRPFTGRCLECGRELYSVAKSFLSYYGVKSYKDKLKAVDRFIAVSSFVEQVYSRYLGLKSEKIVTIPNFYRMETCKDASKVSRVLPKDFILFVGVLAPYKGVDILIKAFEDIDTKAKLVLIGKKIKDYTYENSEKVVVIENAPRNIVKQAYSQCRFAVVPSIWPDPCPTVAFESMASEKAIVASATGGLTDIVINGKTGLLVPPNDIRSLRAAIQKLADQTGETAMMGQLAFQRLKSIFEAKAIVPRIEEVYRTLV
jgi:glycosyltransferase involved in cell wall biosynthesis